MNPYGPFDSNANWFNGKNYKGYQECIDFLLKKLNVEYVLIEEPPVYPTLTGMTKVEVESDNIGKLEMET